MLADLATTLTGLGTLLTGLGTIVTAWGVVRVHRQVRTSNGHTLGELAEITHEEVTTANGIPLGELAERAEGRRVGEIDRTDRTVSEQGYVDRLEAGGRDRGHEDELAG